VIIRPRAWCGAVVFATLVPVVAAAQTPRNPFADLFGRGRDGSGEFTSVQVRTTAGAQIGQTLDSDFDRADEIPEGLAAGADVSLAAEYMRSRFQATGQGRYSYQEYRQEPAFGAPAFDTGGRMSYQATSRVSLQAGGHFARSPFFRLMWLRPEMFGTSSPNGDNAAILMLGNDSAVANAGMSVKLTKRSTVSAEGFTRQTTFDDASVDRFNSRGARGLFRHQISRSLALRAGYGREETRQAFASGGDERFVNEILDAGVDFSKSLSMGRRTTFAFATETSMVRENGGPRHFRLNGNVGLERRFLRTWVSRLSARRATEFMPGFRGPVFTESAHGSLDGYLTKRLLFNANGEGGRGEVGVGDAREFISYTGATSLTFAVTRHFGVFGQYSYAHYQMPPDPLALVTVPRFARQAVSVGVKTWVSIIDKEKVARDSR
jgi:hypothetical protein